ncbi:hypothetical protein KUD11_09965 [Roseovarius sp. LXJ103]|uniref:hypothetical protein n=1 Tax=Roseovarius carneus TaxID=2853164 RepID=UPI000D61A48F|nr:hypothetical protein [Roseovarius carneus]MBZ8118972.1 hypothetical protein [Roseovarius carneus]PWE35373.1 hypothetical protein DD563_04985 [Pelagicola sp. LXJ1103]
MSDRFHTHRDGACLLHARCVPVRWDVEARAVFPDGARGRLAVQVRQDMWRGLRRLRGFAPAVEVVRRDGALHLRAGGQVAGAVPPGTAERIADLLDSRPHRTRWLRGAR